MAKRKRRAKWVLTYDTELSRFFRGEYGADAGLASSFGLQLARARDGLSFSGHSVPDTLPPSVVEFGPFPMRSSTVGHALKVMRPALQVVLREHYTPRPPGSDHGLLGLQPYVALSCLTSVTRKIARRHLAKAKLTDPGMRRGMTPDRAQLEAVLRTLNDAARPDQKREGRQRAKAALRKAQATAKRLLERAQMAYAQARSVPACDDLGPPVGSP